ncbi:hypothetical protein EDB84DRAFT_1438691 [Lactarius hengduanensis]|nr:hypothetical protein EDB84DRAFT_1438691 [Lactarius hengduanensis]
MATIAGGNGGGVAPSPVIVVGAPAPAHRGPGTTDSATTTTDPTTTDGPSPPTSSHQRPPTLAVSVLQGPLDYLKLGNGRSLCFEKQSVPDPPLVSFAKDLPRLVRAWDDSSPEWTPSEAVLRIQGEPIALKHWPTVYRYGKSGQWAGTKKNWAHWRDIATSWQELTETGFWQKFTADGQPMSYTAICEALKEERMAADQLPRRAGQGQVRRRIWGRVRVPEGHARKRRTFVSASLRCTRSCHCHGTTTAALCAVKATVEPRRSYLEALGVGHRAYVYTVVQ